mgnify:CR=1 FL=1
MGAFLRYFHVPQEKDADTAFTLLDAAWYLPSKYYNDEVRGLLIDFAAYWAGQNDARLTVASLMFLREAARNLSRSNPQMERIVSIANGVTQKSLAVTFLQYRILQRAGKDTSATSGLSMSKTSPAKFFWTT